ncbi:MAG TPA: AraC family transcriptional regulator [Gaiellaceae bacterium]|nr:AraC family transcriptional regulator [Gaiellaceae bacterium]
MPETLRGVDRDRLERSCGPGRDSIRFGSGAPGLERAEVHLSTCRFEPHRHDSYLIGITTAGVQTFRYRGARRTALPGELHVLYPDEVHDGAAGTDGGFAYRILYLAPELVQEALGGQALPFVAEPVQRGTASVRAVADLLADLDEPIDDLALAGIAAHVADELRALAGARAPSRSIDLDLLAVRRVHEYLRAHACEQVPASVLERVAGTDRYTIARHFRRAFGTSPDRFRTLRRLALARRAIERGEPIARAAADAGFADQSHLTRQFKRAYGLTPARWRALTSPAGTPGVAPV